MENETQKADLEMQKEIASRARYSYAVLIKNMRFKGISEETNELPTTK